MMYRRQFIVGSSAVFLAGCVKPLIDESVSRSLSVERIVVSVPKFEKLTGRNLKVDPKKLRADIQANLEEQLAPFSNRAGRRVEIGVNVDRLHLVSPGQSFLMGGTSTILGVARVVDLKTREPVLAPTRIVGTGKGYNAGGIIGAIAASGPVKTDYENTVAGFARDLTNQLFGAA
ncbi:MAG: hypothetical protein GY717_17310 [Rhodobacteraceae bacterium]|nr:hypothetical protein [Paracoccaceae bacterium]